MNRLSFVVSAVAICLASLAVAASAQERDWKKELEQQLAELYPLTKMDNRLFAGRTSLRGAGIVLVVQQAGLSSNDGKGIFGRFALVRDGVVTNPQGRTGPGAHISEIGEQVYIREIEVDDDNVDFKFLTVDPIETMSRGTTRAQRYYGMVRFEFAKGALRSMTAADIARVVGEVLATEAEIQATRTLELGQTFEQVEAILGKPTTVAKLGAKTIYSYPNMKVIFTDGKVTDVQ